MKLIHCLTVLCVLALFGTHALAAESLYIVNARPDLASSDLARNELAHYLPQLTGQEVKIIEGAEKWNAQQQRPAIVLGRGPDGAEVGSDTRDAFRLLSQGNVLYIFGNDGEGSVYSSAPKGTLYGTYHYLRDSYGVRWVMPGELGEVLPAGTQPVKVTGFDDQQVPGFHQRVLNDGVWPGGYPEFKQPLGLTEADDERLQELQRQWLIRNGAQTTWFVLGKHAFRDWWEKYHEQHPDWFAMHRNGERTVHGRPGRVKLCVSNPQVIEQAVKQGLEDLERNRYYVSITGSPNDSGLSNFCMCPDCKALDPQRPARVGLNDAAGSFQYVPLSDRYAWFWSRMAERLVQHHPDKKVAAYAYYATSEPPVRTRLHPNVLIGFVQQAASYWDDETWRNERRKFDGWTDMGGKGYWRPNALLVGHGLPSNYLDRLADDIRHIHRRGTRYVFYDSMIPNWGTGGHHYYVLAHLLWDPEADPDQLLQDYLQAAYGSAASDVEAYLDELARITTRISKSGLVSSRMWRASQEMAAAAIIREADLVKLEQHLDRAVRTVEPSSGAAKRLALLQGGLAFARVQLPVYRELYLSKGELNFEEAPLAEVIATRDQWLEDHADTLAVRAPYILRYADVMQGIASKVRDRLEVPEMVGE